MSIQPTGIYRTEVSTSYAFVSSLPVVGTILNIVNWYAFKNLMSSSGQSVESTRAHIKNRFSSVTTTGSECVQQLVAIAKEEDEKITRNYEQNMRTGLVYSSTSLISSLLTLAGVISLIALGIIPVQFELIALTISASFVLFNSAWVYSGCQYLSKMRPQQVLR